MLYNVINFTDTSYKFAIFTLYLNKIGICCLLIGSHLIYMYVYMYITQKIEI